MTKSIRLALIAGVGAIALAFAGSALAAFSPKITISNATQASGGVQFDAQVGATDDPTAQVQFYVPLGYQLSSPSPGTKIGSVTAQAQAADLGGAVLPLTGDLLAVDPKQFATQQAACGIPSVAATWDLHLTAAGQVLDVPIFVVATAGAETSLAQYKLLICLPPPDVPAGTPGRATFGAKLLRATFNATALTSPTTPGEYRWRSLWTPYTPNTGKPNPAGTVEVQSIVRLPTQLKIAVKKAKVVKTVKVKGKKVKRVWTRATLAGSLTENGQPITGVTVTVAVNKKPVKTTTVSDKGTFSYAVLFNAGTKTFSASAKYDARDLGAAGCVKTFAAPCADATIGGATLTSNSVKVAAFKR